MNRAHDGGHTEHVSLSMAAERGWMVRAFTRDRGSGKRPVTERPVTAQEQAQAQAQEQERESRSRGSGSWSWFENKRLQPK